MSQWSSAAYESSLQAAFILRKLGTDIRLSRHNLFHKGTSTMRSTTILLSSESTEEFASLCARISEEIQPEGEIEKLFTDDIAPNTSDIHRITRNKIGIIRNAFPAALQNLLKQ